MKTMKKLCALMMALFLVVGISAPSAKAAGSRTAKYTDGYKIEKLLSQFQFVIKDDVELGGGGHTVGSIAVGGKLTLNNSFGDAGVVPSYISNYVSGGLGTGWHGAVPVKSEVVYYGTAAGYVDSNWIQNPGYMNLKDGFEKEIEKQSAGLLTGAVPVSVNNGSITIDVTGVTDDEVKYVIPYADFAAANSMNIVAPNIEWFRTHICVISIQDAGKNNFTFSAYGKITINGVSLETALEALPGQDSEYNKQLNVGGMNLIWNFPDAEGVIGAPGLGGHLVAPKAEVNVEGNYEGGIIARKLSGSAQGHFYPMTMYLSGDSDPDEEVKGADATFSKKAVSLSGEELPGAELTLIYLSATNDTDLSNVTKKSGPGITIKADNTQITWTSTGTPLTLSKLPDGEYKLTETAAPKGYKYAADIEFKIEGGKVYQKVNGSYSSKDTPTVTMVDEVKVTGELVVNVFDEKTGDKVPDAEVEVTYPDGTKHRHTTGPDGSFTIDEADPGDYNIEVKEVPDGYDVTEGKTESAEVKPDETTIHNVYINNTSDDTTPGDTPGGPTPGDTPGGPTPGDTPGGPTPGDTPGGPTPGDTPGGTTPDGSTPGNGTGTTVTNGTTNSTNTTNKTNTDSAVRTSDDSNLLLPIVLLAVSVLGIVVVAYRKKKLM